MKRLLVVLLMALLAGCAVKPPRPPATSRELAWQERQALLQPVQQWKLTGRLAIKTGDEGGNATFIWQQNPDSFQMQLVAPLGQGSLQLSGDAQGALLRDSDGRSAVAADAEILLLEQLGWRIPVRDLRYWVLGLAAPGQASIELDEFGRLARLRQDDWEVTFLDYSMEGSTELPARIFITNHQAQVRLVIKRWELGDAGTR